MCTVASRGVEGRFCRTGPPARFSPRCAHRVQDRQDGSAAGRLSSRMGHDPHPAKSEGRTRERPLTRLGGRTLFQARLSFGSASGVSGCCFCQVGRLQRNRCRSVPDQANGMPATRKRIARVIGGDPAGVFSDSPCKRGAASASNHTQSESAFFPPRFGPQKPCRP